MRSVGGTLVSKIVGMSKWGGPVSAYFELTQGVEAPREPAMTRGNVLEASVLSLWAERNGTSWLPGIRVQPIKEQAMTYAHATLDAFGRMIPGDPDCLLDAKTVAREQVGDDWGPDGSDRLPVEYQLQLLWYHGVCRAAGMTIAEDAYVPTLMGPEAELAMAARLVERTGKPLTLADLEGTNLELRTYRVPWDTAGQKLFRLLDARVQCFLREHVEPGIPPEPTEADLTGRDLNAVARGLRSDPGSALDLEKMEPAAQAVLLELLEANRQRKAWKGLEEQAVARAQLVLGSTEEVRGLPGGARVTWKTISTGSRRFEIREPKR